MVRPAARRAKPRIDLRDRKNRHYATIPAIERFWAKVKRMPSGCWEWQGYREGDKGRPASSTGYGHFDAGNGIHLAHRYAYEVLVGPIPEGMTIDHLCRNPPCVNPSHLEPVTQAENNRRGRLYLQPRPPKTHCPRDHEFTPENTRITPDGGRHCRVCDVLARERRSEARRQARIERDGFDAGPKSRAHNAEYFRDLYTGQPRGTKFVGEDHQAWYAEQIAGQPHELA